MARSLDRWFPGPRLSAGTLAFTILLAALGVVGIGFNFLLFHTLAELFSVAIAVLAGVVAWYTYRFFRHPLFVFLGCAYPWIALVDLLHTVTYSGMGIYPELAPNLPTQLWLTARLLEAGVLLLAPGFILRRVSPQPVVAGVGGVTLALLALVAVGLFPQAFAPETGLTAFKVAGEYLIIALLLGAALRFLRHRHELEPYTLTLLLTAIGLTVAAESFFASYAKVDDWLNGLGHIFKVLSYWMIFLGVVRSSLLQPLQERTLVLDHAGEGLFLLDPDRRRLLYANGAGRRLLSDQPDGTPPRGAWARILGAGSTWGPFIERVRNQPGRVESVSMPDADGERSLEISYRLADESGQSYLVAVARDVTGRLRVARERDRLAAILEATPDLVGIADRHGTVSFVNQAARLRLGVSGDQPMRVDDLHPPLARRILREEALPTALREGYWAGDTTFLDAKGGEFPVWQTIIAHRDKDGELDYFSTIAHDISELKSAQEQLRRLATTDFLTGIYNRQKIEQLLDQELARAARYPGGVSVLMLDIDHFKRVNDRFGHDAGDAALKAITAIVRRHLRATDSFGRWGGEEFMVLAPETGLDGAEALAEKLRAAVAAEPIPPAGSITISIGVAEYREGEPASALERRVDAALYRAKETGRNRVCRAEEAAEAQESR